MATMCNATAVEGLGGGWGGGESIIRDGRPARGGAGGGGGGGGEYKGVGWGRQAADSAGLSPQIRRMSTFVFFSGRGRWLAVPVARGPVNQWAKQLC